MCRVPTFSYLTAEWKLGNQSAEHRYSLGGSKTFLQIISKCLLLNETKTLADTEMFLHLTKLIKAVLAVSRSNANVERSLSVNKHAAGKNMTLLIQE